MPVSRIGHVEGIDRVAEPALLAHLLEQPRRHAAAEHVGEHLQAVEVGIALRQALHAPARRAPARDRAPRCGCRRRSARARGAGAAGPVKLAKRCSTSPTTCLVVDRAGGRDHHVGRAVVARRDRRAASSRSNERTVVGRAQDRAADRLAGKRGLLQLVEHEIVGRVLGRADLLHDDVLLALQLLRIERRIRTGCRKARRARAARRP